MPEISNTIILPQINPLRRSLARGLVFAGWPGKHYAATLKDMSGYGYDVSYAGTIAGANNSIDSKLGPVFQTGSSSKRYRGTVNEPAQQSGGPWTLMSWVKPNTLAMGNDGYFLTYRNFGSHYPLNLAMVKTTGVVSLIIVGAGDSPTKQVSGTKGMTAGKWTHACGVYVPSSKIEIYFDGILDTTNTTSIPSAAGTWTDIAWNIGGPQSDSFSFDGWMSHVYVWNRALTAGEVRQFYEDPWILFRYDLSPGKGPGASIFTFSYSDAWTEADASAYLTNSFRATSDTWTDADLTANLTQSLRAISDTWTLADAFSVTMGVVTWALSIIETWLVADSTVRVSDGLRTASDTWLSSDSMARIADGKRNPIDSIVLTADTFDRLSDAFRVVTEPVLVADNAFHWNTYKRAFEDAWQASDSTAAGLVMLRRIVEAMLFADSSAIATTARRALSDTITLADSLSRVVSFKRQTTDTVSISDSMARIAANLRAIQDSLAVAADSISRVSTGNRQVADSSLVIADAFKRIASAARRISDSLVLSDSVAALATRIVSIVDAWLAADSVGRSVASKRTVSDSWGLADSARKLVGWLRSISDSIVVSDAVGRKGTAKRTVSDTLAVSDDLRAIMVFARRILESILLQSDTLTRTATAKRSVSDSYTVRADIISRVVASARGILDALAIADTVARRQALGAAITETIGIADGISRKSNSARQIADAMKIADAIARLADGHRGVVDYVSVSDSVRRIASAARQIADALKMQDSAARISNAVRTLSEAFGVRDAGATIDLILQLLAGWLAPPRPVVWQAPPRGILWTSPARAVIWKPKSSENLTMPVVAKEQLEKQPSEIITYAMDFSELLDANELSTTEALASVTSVTASPSGLTLGSGSISGDRVTFSVSGGTDGTTYRIEVTVTTSTGNTRVADGMLVVKD